MSGVSCVDCLIIGASPSRARAIWILFLSLRRTVKSSEQFGLLEAFAVMSPIPSSLNFANRILFDSLVLADVSPGPDPSLDHQPFAGLQLRTRVSQNRS